MSMPVDERVDAERLTGFCTRVLAAVGLTEQDATAMAASLVAADLRGTASHGVLRLPVYVRRIRAGLIAARPRITVTRTAAAAAVLDGGDGPGQVVTLRAMQEAMALAREAGAGVVAVRNSNHFGAAGYYAQHAAEQGMVGWAVTHAEADVIPFGGRTPALGTNPLAIAVPRAGGPPVVLDMATSIVPMGRVILAAQEGRPIPADWAVDAEGDPTTDARKARAVRPMAGPKGYGLAVMIDLLIAGLTGSAFGTGIRRMYDDFEHPHGVGHLVGALDVAAFTEPRQFTEQTERLATALKAVEPAEGVDEVLLPGEVEHRAAERHRREGIPLSPETRRALITLGEDLGVPWPT